MNQRSGLDSLLAGLLAALGLSAAACGAKESPTPSPFACESPQPATGTADGFVRCEGEWMHRPEVRECQDALPRPTMCTEDPASHCRQDADCTDMPNGACTPGFDDGGCYCEYGCRNDAECGPGFICMCGDPVGQCAPATCTVDADCDEGLCANYDASPNCYNISFACQSADDQCASSSDCPDFLECTIVEGEAHRSCVDPSCAIGRPFLVAGAARVAPLAARGDWSAAMAVRVEGLAAGDREALAEHWAQAGSMEHASIAAFARFAMQLLAMGAPPRLIADAQAAMGDELGHARVCFGLASAYAGRDVGPGALDIREALAGDAREFVVTAVHEGCVGETVAALEASEAARHAVDPVVRAALAEIAVDEGRHAELAWRFVQWAVQRDPGLRAAAVEAFATALDGVAAGGQGREDLLRFGVLGPAARGSLRRAALAQVIGPCARTLLAGPRVDAAVASAVASA
jgi:hypothetical protein